MTKTKKQNSNNKKTRKKRVFKKDDFVAGDGMLTTVWGAPMWHYLHTMSFNYPVNPSLEEKHNYRNFVLNLKNVLPCKYCRKNLKANFKKLPLTMTHMKDRDSFSRYLYELHELVNHMLKKKSGLTYCDVRERYEHFRARCTDEHTESTNKPESTKEKGCTEPLYGKKSKCVLNIVPKEERVETFKVDKECIKTIH